MGSFRLAPGLTDTRADPVAPLIGYVLLDKAHIPMSKSHFSVPKKCRKDIQDPSFWRRIRQGYVPTIYPAISDFNTVNGLVAYLTFGPFSLHDEVHQSIFRERHNAWSRNSLPSLRTPNSPIPRHSNFVKQELGLEKDSSHRCNHRWVACTRLHNHLYDLM